MSNKTSKKVPVNKKYFLEVLHAHDCSIRKLGDAYNEIERTEKTIRRCLDDGEFPPDLLDRIAKYLDVHPKLLSGEYYEKADEIEDEFLQKMYKASINFEKYPHLSKAKSKIGYIQYFEDILIMNDISIEQFHTLTPEKRILFRQEMNVAILQVIEKYFTHDSLGNNLSDTLTYCESLVGDYDPFSYYAELEGISLPNPAIDNDFFDENDMREFEERMRKKHKIK